MRAFTLSGIKAGITRLRQKGGASASSLWDLVNAYVNASGDIVPRQGSRLAANLTPGTVGLTVFDGTRHVYASAFVDLSAVPGYRLHVLPHPTDPERTLVDVPFSEPLMGYLYVVAEFDNGDIQHYYLTEGPNGGSTWLPDHVYLTTDTVVPTAPQGLVYRPMRTTAPFPTWKPETQYSIGDKVEPSTYNGYYYELVDAQGTPVTSGATEPAWIATEGVDVFEDVSTGASTTPPDPTLPPEIPDRYPPQFFGGGGGAGGTGTENVA